MSEWLNQKNIAVNKLLPSLADGKNVIFVDIWKPFLGADGEADKALYRDTTHFNATGYARYAGALQPCIKSASKELAF
jgi:lysophospholipase L1-like esterase